MSTAPVLMLPAFATDIPGGRFNMSGIGRRIKPDKRAERPVPFYDTATTGRNIPGGKIPSTPRNCAVGPIGDLNNARLREAKISTAPILILPAFGSDIPGGHFNLAGSKPSSGGSDTGPPLYGAVSAPPTPGGKFNMSGSRKRRFRVTYLDTQ